MRRVKERKQQRLGRQARNERLRRPHLHRKAHRAGASHPQIHCGRPICGKLETEHRVPIVDVALRDGPPVSGDPLPVPAVLLRLEQRDVVEQRRAQFEQPDRRRPRRTVQREPQPDRALDVAERGRRVPNLERFSHFGAGQLIHRQCIGRIAQQCPIAIQLNLARIGQAYFGRCRRLPGPAEQQRAEKPKRGLKANLCRKGHDWNSFGRHTSRSPSERPGFFLYCTIARVSTHAARAMREP